MTCACFILVRRGTAFSRVAVQDALTVLATAIGKIGLTVGVVCFVVLFVR